MTEGPLGPGMVRFTWCSLWHIRWRDLVRPRQLITDMMETFVLRESSPEKIRRWVNLMSLSLPTSQDCLGKRKQRHSGGPERNRTNGG